MFDKEFRELLLQYRFKIIDLKTILEDEVLAASDEEKEKKIKNLNNFKAKETEFEKQVSDLVFAMADRLSDEAKKITKDMKDHLKKLKKIVDNYNDTLNAIDSAMTALSEFIQFAMRAAVSLGKKAATGGVVA